MPLPVASKNNPDALRACTNGVKRILPFSMIVLAIIIYLNMTPKNPNRALLDQVNESQSWFHAKKVEPVWAMQATSDGTLESLENRNGQVEKYSAGDFICKGVAGEKWPQAPDRFQSKYDATEEIDDEGFRKYLPKSEVLAAKIETAFSVQATWAELHGKPGDYLLKSYSNRNTEYPEDVWIVDAKIFQRTYKRMEQ